MKVPIHSNEWEMLSAYLDGQMTESEQRRVRDLLARSAELQAGLEELRRTRAVLRAAPRRRVPRNFTLTPAMAQKARPHFRWSWAPSLGVASALATVLLVLTFFLQFPPASLTTMSAPAATSRDLQNQAAEQKTAPPIILWNSPVIGMGGGSSGAPAPDTSFQSTPEVLVDPAPSNGQPAATQGPLPVSPLAATAAPGSLPTPPAGVVPRIAAIPPTATLGESSKSASQAAPSGAASDNSGPILGIASTEDRGKMVVPTLASPDTYGVRAADVPAPSNIRTVQIALGAIAVLTGLTALFFWWRSRH